MADVPEAFTTRTFNFACRIVRLYRELNRIPDVPLPLARQLLRAGTSIGANLEEARAAQSRKDLAAKFSIALKEARETKYWLRLLAATQQASSQGLTSSIQEADELVAILTVSVRRLKSESDG